MPFDMAELERLPKWAIPVALGGGAGLIVLLRRMGTQPAGGTGTMNPPTDRNPTVAPGSGNVYLPPAAVSSDTQATYPSDSVQALLQQLQQMGLNNQQNGTGLVAGGTDTTGTSIAPPAAPPAPVGIVQPPPAVTPPPIPAPAPAPAVTPGPIATTPPPTPPPVQTPNPPGYVKAPPATQPWEPNGWLPNWLPNGSFLYPNGSTTPVWDRSVILTRRGTPVQVPSFYDTSKPGYKNHLYPYGDHYFYDNYGVIRDRLSDIQESASGAWASHGNNPADPYNVYIIFRGALNSMVHSNVYPGGDPNAVTGWTSATFFLA